MSPAAPTLKLVTAEPPSGAPLSLDEAFRQYGKYVAGIAYRLLGRDEDVNDVVQDVFFHALSKLKQLRDPAALKGWLATVTVRMVRRRLRIRSLKGFLGLESVSPSEHLVAFDVAPDDRMLLGMVYGVLDELPANERLAWTLRYIEGEQLEDVARLCGCSLATAKRRIAAAHVVIEQAVSDE